MVDHRQMLATNVGAIVAQKVAGYPVPIHDVAVAIGGEESAVDDVAQQPADHLLALFALGSLLQLLALIEYLEHLRIRPSLEARWVESVRGARRLHDIDDATSCSRPPNRCVHCAVKDLAGGAPETPPSAP